MATIVKANDSSALNSGTSWVGGVAPGTGDIGQWDSNVTGANACNPGAALSWSGLKITNPGGAVTINSDGNTLTLGASGLDLSTAIRDFTCAANLASGNNTQTWNVGSRNVLITGNLTHNGGTITYSGTGSVITTGAPTLSIGASTGTTVDISGLTKFNGSFGTFGIGFGSGGVASTLNLAPDSTVVATSINIGASGSNVSATGTLRMGGTNNQLQADTWILGQRRSSGTLNFLSGGSCVIKGTTGGAAKSSVLLGDYNTNGTAQTPTGTMNFTGGTVTAQISNLICGQQSMNGNSNAASTPTGTFTCDGAASSVSIDTAYIGYWAVNRSPSATSGATGTLTITNGAVTVGTLRLADMGSFGANSNGFIKTNGTVTIANGSLTVNTAFVIGDTDWTGNTASQVTALLNITGGTVNANCNIKTSPTTDNVATYPTKSTLTLNGGILNMAGHNIGTAGAGVGTGGGAINWQAGTLTSCGTINGTGGLTKTTAGTLILTGTNAWSGDTTVSGGILTVNGTISASSALTANSTTTVNGTGTISCGSTFTSATLTPGNGSTYGLLTTGDITLDSGSTYTLNLDGNHVTLDGVSVTGTYTCGSAILTISSVANPTYTTYTVVTATSISGTFNGLADGATFSAVGRSWRIHYTGTTITLDDYNPGAASNVIQALLTYN